MSTQTTHPWLIVTLREVETKLRDKAFIISTLVTLLLIIGSIAVTGFLATRTTQFTVAATDQVSLTVLNQAASDAEEQLKINVEQLPADAATAQLDAGQIDATLSQNSANKFMLTGSDEVPGKLQGALREATEKVLTAQLLTSAGLNADQLPGDDALEVTQMRGDAERSSMIQAMAFLFSFLFYMSAIIFGMPIANSVIEEKQNRVVEILASAINLRQLLAGKILGNVILALAQLLLFLAVGLLAAYLSPVQIPFLGVVSQVAGWFVVFFLGGFLVLAGIWATLGALASRTEDLQQSSGPVVGVLMAVLFIGIYAKGGFLVIASYVPIVSSVAMPIRLLGGEVSLVEPLISLVITLATCWFTILFAERIYRRAVMHTGGALSIRKALKLEL
ncbi:ABC transporter permease [Glutamicibacter sp. BW77]|uniref:ABC transporter permease n=1 Tax=Glutamicibacter bergerei TaxID=256702 RepID=A0ABV9MGZ8_9MICC|nr:ABC transporter permease [Glutamicibacter sp. BW77]PCC35254.1 multidrug ABC transporter permease [Glutamicibacter sp. BW77]HBV09370.1 ABC transporter permease [Micrococcaceae bacterium]